MYLREERWTMIKMLLTLLTAAVLTAGCSKPDLSQYRDNEPRFSLFEYFDGQTTGWGMVQDRNGNLIRRFVVDIRGSVDGSGTLVLDEKFEWSDGERSSRIWSISKTGENSFTGTAADVNGTASGSAYGNVLNWRYYLNIEAGGRTWKVHLDDWMYLQEDNVLINKTKMSKFGFSLGDITIVFQKNGRRQHS
jgi:hypothetical protein